MKTTQKLHPSSLLFWFGWEAYLEDPAFLWQQIVCWFKGILSSSTTLFSQTHAETSGEFSCSRCGICIQGTGDKK